LILTGKLTEIMHKKFMEILVIYKNVIIIPEKIIASHSTLSYTKEYQSLEKWFSDTFRKVSGLFDTR
jgi:hypothetical protein